MRALLLSLLLVMNVYSLELKSRWTASFEKEIVITCSAGQENQCNYLCGSNTNCSFIEGYCRDCAGTSLYLKALFSEMGTRYRSNENEVDLYDFFDFLNTGDFITISSRSIYNFVTSYNSLDLRRRFRKLCGNQDHDPVVFLEAIGNARLLGKIRYVACNMPELRVREMEESIDIIINY